MVLFGHVVKIGNIWDIMKKRGKIGKIFKLRYSGEIENIWDTGKVEKIENVQNKNREYQLN